MSEDQSVIGGTTSDKRFVCIFIVGVLIGSSVRVAGWLLSDEIVSTVKNFLP